MLQSEYIKEKLSSEEFKEKFIKSWITHLSLFGSYARNEATKESDLDLVYELDGKHITTLWVLQNLEDILIKEFNVKKVDFVSKRKINQYLNTARLYLNQTPNIDQNTLKTYVLEDLKTETTVKMLNPNTNNSDESMMQYYFNFLAYTFMFVIIIGVSNIMLVFNTPTIKKRNACSPVP